MLRRSTIIVLVGALLSSAWSTWASAQTEQTHLRLKLNPGQVVAYNIVRTYDLTEFPGPPAHTMIEGHEIHRVLEVASDGNLLVEIVIEDGKVTDRGTTREIRPQPEIFRIQPNGRVLELVSELDRLLGRKPSFPEQFPIPLPPGPVSIGDTWQEKLNLKESELVISGKVTYTMVGVERVGGDLVAQIREHADSTVTGESKGSRIVFLPTDLGVPEIWILSEVRARASGTFLATGDIAWSVDAGHLLKHQTTLMMDVAQEVTEQGRSRVIKTTTKGTFRQGLIPLLAPSLPPSDYLIEPGSKVGRFAITQSISELTSLLGAPTSQSSLGVRTQRLGWRDGLVAHIDPADPGRPVALEVTDKRFRTAAGIGLGSTEGAALITYGLSPVKKDVSSARLGGFRALIYDEQGIAFIVATDPFGTELGRIRAPIGTVEFTLIFPPGPAARIFFLP